MKRALELLDRLGHAVIATDHAGHINHWNRHAEKLYGWRIDEVRGRNIMEVTVPASAQIDGAGIMRALAAGQVWSGEFPVQRRDGSTFNAAVTDIPMGDGVAGVSAKSGKHSRLSTLLRRFAKAANATWPDAVTLDAKVDGAIAAASDPHILQLLAILLRLECADGERTEISAQLCTQSIYEDFGIRAPERGAVYLRMRRSDARHAPVLKEVMRSVAPSSYAAALVALASGKLFTGGGLHVILGANN